MAFENHSRVSSVGVAALTSCSSSRRTYRVWRACVGHSTRARGSYTDDCGSCDASLVRRMTLRIMRAAALAAVLVLALVASAQEIQRWRTPDGRLYFGINPPEGSTLITAPERGPARPTLSPAPRPHFDP